MVVSAELQAIWDEVARIGTAWTGAAADTFRDLYEPTHKALEAQHSSLPVIKDVKYGPHPRNVLDVYKPPGRSEPRPIVIYIHGGGYFAGAKDWSQHLYRNIGYYFASLGYVTCCANYRLVGQDAFFPSGPEDIAAMVAWAQQSGNEYGGDPAKVVLVGQSSGAAHIATYLFRDGDPANTLPCRSDGQADVQGVALLSGPHFFHPQPRRLQTLREYYGTDELEKVRPRSGVGLLERCPPSNPNADPRKLRLYVTVGQQDSAEISEANLAFVEAYRKHNKGTWPLFSVTPDHNHLTNVLSIGTEDDAPGQHLAAYIASVVGA